MHLHEFLAEVHAIVKPKVYLEVGVQHGTSLNLSKAAELAIGVDPAPLHVPCCNQAIYNQESDTFFASGAMGVVRREIDFGFIDGLHHAEQAARDFYNIYTHLSPAGIIIFDDVLPRNQGEANRVQCPGDWTGDVWKIAEYMSHNAGFQYMAVNTQPTGVLVVTGAIEDAVSELRWGYPELGWDQDRDVPDYILNRMGAWEPGPALDELRSIPWNP